jgi:RND family efflux transporter MFP subunit
MSQPFTTPLTVSKRRVSTKRKVAVMMLAAALIAATVAGIAMRGHAPAAPPPPAASALTVAVVQPRQVRWTESIDVSGAIAPWQEASIRSLLTGERLTQVEVDVGSVVKRGQLLARYDTTMLKAVAAQSAAALAQAQASAQQARTNESRALQMNDSGGISKQDLLQYRTTAQVTKAQEDAARAQLQARMIDLQNASVLAPDDGTISARTATLGSVAPVGQELFRLIRQDRLQWQAEVTAAEVASIRIGQHIVLLLPDNTLASGTVARIAPSLDPQSRVALIYADLEPGSHARAGMYTGGRIVLGESNALVIPASALAMHEGRNNVAIVVDRNGTERVSLREVTTGRREGNSVEVVHGLTGTERIVGNGAGLLNEGDLVTLASAPALLAKKEKTGTRQ